MCWFACGVFHDIAHGLDVTRHAVAASADATKNFTLKYRTTIAGALTLVACTASGIVICGVVAAAALAVRVQSRIEKQGFRKSLGANVADAIISVGTFGVMKIPLAQVERGVFSPAQRLIISGTVSAPAVVNAFWQYSASHEH